MKYLLAVLAIASLILLPSFMQQSEQVQENLFYGKSSLKIPTTIQLQEKTKFYTTILYQKGPFTLTDLNAMVDVYPQSASEFVKVEMESSELSLSYLYAPTLQGTITVDPQIPVTEIFLTIYYTAKDSQGTIYKSAWTDSSEPIWIKGMPEYEECEKTVVSGQHGQPIDLKYDIEGGMVINICKFESNNSVITKINAQKSGHLTISIPKKIVYTLSSKDCTDDSDLFILMDKEVILPAKAIQSKKDKTITVAFSKGFHTIEFIGFSIIPDPSPSQYCGVVMGFDSLYLPPKFQIERGMKSEQVKCNKDLALLKKASNNIPICVSFETGQKLLERNLAHTIARTGVVDSDNENTHEKEITILSITPQNVTLPEPKNQTHKTKCNEEGVCFTPE